MKRLFFTLTMFLLISFSVFAQKKKIKFNSINTFEMITGESLLSIGFQTVNGIRFSNWFSGIGIGIDYYQYKTLPLFFDGRRYFGSEKKAFVYGDIGYNFPMKNKPRKEMGYYDTYHFKGGIYTELGIGFKTKLIKKSSLVFSIGQSYKQLQTRVGIVPMCVGCDPYWYNYKLTYGRIIVKAGFIL